MLLVRSLRHRDVTIADRPRTGALACPVLLALGPLNYVSAAYDYMTEIR